MDFSKISYSQVGNYAGELERLSGEMGDILNNITSEFAKVGSGDAWSGTAASQTKATFDELSAKFPEFSAAIMDCSKYLKEVVANFQAVDQAVTGTN